MLIWLFKETIILPKKFTEIYETGLFTLKLTRVSRLASALWEKLEFMIIISFTWISAEKCKIIELSSELLKNFIIFYISYRTLPKSRKYECDQLNEGNWIIRCLEEF